MTADIFVWYAEYVAMGAAALMFLFLLVFVIDMARIWWKYWR